MDSYLPVILTGVLSGGLLTGIAIFIKAKPEAGQVIVQSAESVVVIQKGLIDELREKIDEDALEWRRNIETLRLEIAALRAELSETKTQRDSLASENAALKEEVASLHAQVDTLKTQVAQLEANGGNGG